MKNLLNPKWLLVINSIPVIILYLIYSSEYHVIKSLLDEESISLWINFGGILLVLSIMLIGYIVFLIHNKKSVSIYYAFSALIMYTAFLYAFSIYSNDIIPWSIPRWMISSDAILYPGTFLMPTLIHALFVIVLKLTSKEKNHKAWKNFVVVILVPIFTYMFLQVILPLWKPVNYRFRDHVFTIFCVLGVIVFLFFLIRGIYVISLKKGKSRKELYFIMKLLIGLLFPIIGLSINASFGDVFGNFTSVWFFLFSVVNGILLVIPPQKNTKHRLILFIAKCITFSFTLYFFLVFLPYLPLSVIAIVAIGAGFLMLTPLVLFVIHTQELSRDFKYLSNFYKKTTLYLVLILGFLALPTAISINYASHKYTLNKTLDFIYAPDYAKEYSINTTLLKRTLNAVKRTKSRRRDFFMGSHTPYLSNYFHWFVLDNLTLSDTKINTIENIFFKAESSFRLTEERLRNQDVEISNISSSSTYNKTEKSWTSWVDIEITNSNSNNFTSEYATSIDLPDGCWINDYYLYVGDRKEMGLLTEKKSAIWIFSEIRNINRDPGLLHYKTGNEVAFRVFPFAKNEVRKTGIQFIHKDPVTIEIDGHRLNLGEAINSFSETSTDNGVMYLSAKEKSKLQTVKRQPYYHFIVDISKEKDSLIENYKTTISNFLSKSELDHTNAKISYTNTFTTTQDFNEGWKASLDNQTFEGGFYLERAIKKILFSTYTNTSNDYPIIVVVTDNMLDAIVEKNFADFKIAYPESNMFYHLNTLGYLASHNLNKAPKQSINDNVSINTNNDVLAYPNLNNPIAYLPNDNQPSIVLKNSIFMFDETGINSNWNTGLQLQGKWLSDVFYPELGDKDWLNSIQHSFKSKIMTPLTSYIVVETEAQKAALLRKQEQVLKGKKSLDLNERTQRMSEPNLMVIALFVLGLLFLYRRRKITLL